MENIKVIVQQTWTFKKKMVSSVEVSFCLLATIDISKQTHPHSCLVFKSQII